MKERTTNAAQQQRGLGAGDLCSSPSSPAINL